MREGIVSLRFWASSSSGIQILAVSPHHCQGGDLAEAARDGNVEAAEHFVKVSPESINSKDIFGGVPRRVMAHNLWHTLSLVYIKYIV